MIPFRVKICGVTRQRDALAASRFGADAIGFNFYARSLRSVLPDQARQLGADLPAEVIRVGVFVNSPPDEIRNIARIARLDWIQLHGDETPESHGRLASEYRLIRALRVPPLEESDSVGEPAANDAPLEARRALLTPQIKSWQDAGVAAFLLDTARGGQFGGTGAVFPWELVPRLPRSLPLLLAGGLTLENVARAIEIARPDGVDVASGVEGFPGGKDELAMKGFISAARQAGNWPHPR